MTDQQAQYLADLQTTDWRRRRWEYLTAHPHCANCGSNTNLNVHHPRYINGRRAWEYADRELITLCRKCHVLVHAREHSGTLHGIASTVSQLLAVRPVTRSDAEIMCGAAVKVAEAAEYARLGRRKKELEQDLREAR